MRPQWDPSVTLVGNQWDLAPPHQVEALEAELAASQERARAARQTLDAQVAALQRQLEAMHARAAQPSGAALEARVRPAAAARSHALRSTPCTARSVHRALRAARPPRSHGGGARGEPGLCACGEVE